MCFGGGSKSTDVSSTPAYAPTPEGGAGAIIQESVGPDASKAKNGLSDATTMSEVTSTPRIGAGTGLKIN